ncbi:hypothetical protein OK016_27450 [Vibrio chagasii]|nr:hypothetical protein [Vibrio chagasii]
MLLMVVRPWLCEHQGERRSRQHYLNNNFHQLVPFIEQTIFSLPLPPTVPIDIQLRFSEPFISYYSVVRVG